MGLGCVRFGSLVVILKCWAVSGGVILLVLMIVLILLILLSLMSLLILLVLLMPLVLLILLTVLSRGDGVCVSDSVSPGDSACACLACV